MEQKVVQSIPRSRSMRAWVSFMVVSLSSAQAWPSASHRWSAKVPRPLLVLVRMTR